MAQPANLQQPAKSTTNPGASGALEPAPGVYPPPRMEAKPAREPVPPLRETGSGASGSAASAPAAPLYASRSPSLLTDTATRAMVFTTTATLPTTRTSTTTTSTTTTSTTTSTAHAGSGSALAHALSQLNEIPLPDHASLLVDALIKDDAKVLAQVYRKLKRGATAAAKRLHKPDMRSELIKRVLNQPCLVDSFFGPRAMTPLMAAASKGNLRAIRTFLARGADPNLCSADQACALMLAGTADCARLLLDAGANPDLHCPKYGTTLIRAVYLEREEALMELLLKAGSKVNQLVPCASFAVLLEHMLEHRKHFRPSFHLRPQVTGQAPWQDPGVSALMVAAAKGMLGTLDLLLKAGADPELRGGPCGYTALMMAVAGLAPAAVQVLLQYKANVNASAGDGGTPLYLATRKGDCQIMQILIDAGAEVEQEDSQGLTALTRLTREYHARCCALTPSRYQQARQILIRAGADPEHRDGEGRIWSDKSN